MSRTLASYILAALIAALPFSVPVLVFSAAYATYYRTGEAPIPADEFALSIAMAAPWHLAFAVVMFLVAGTSWKLFSGRLRAMLSRFFVAANDLIIGVALGAVLAVLGLAIRMIGWWEDFSYQPASNVAWAFIPALLAGALWGGVFRLRTPKSLRHAT